MSAALHVVAIVVWGTATSVSMFVAASVFLGAGRALSSGPLEAWFVDAILSSDAEADLKPGLARGGTAEGIALCLGTVVGGALPRLAPGLPALGQDTFISLSVPFGVAALMTLGYMAAVFRLISESEGRKGQTTGTFRSVRRTIRSALVTARKDPVLNRVLIVSGLLGAVVYGIEILSPSMFAELLGTEDGTAFFGVLAAAGFGASALGAMGGATVGRWARSSARGSALFIACMAAL